MIIDVCPEMGDYYLENEGIIEVLEAYQAPNQRLEKMGESLIEKIK